jgi:hypothetical protein
MHPRLRERRLLVAHVFAAALMFALALAAGASVVVVPLVALVLGIHFVATSALPSRIATAAAVVAILFAAAVPLWSGSDAVDCDPSCSTYQDVIAAAFVIAVVAFSIDVLAGAVAGLRAVVRRARAGDGS